MKDVRLRAINDVGKRWLDLKRISVKKKMSFFQPTHASLPKNSWEERGKDSLPKIADEELLIYEVYLPQHCLFSALLLLWEGVLDRLSDVEWYLIWTVSPFSSFLICFVLMYYYPAAITLYWIHIISELIFFFLAIF